MKAITTVQSALGIIQRRGIIDKIEGCIRIPGSSSRGRVVLNKRGKTSGRRREGANEKVYLHPLGHLSKGIGG